MTYGHAPPVRDLPRSATSRLQVLNLGREIGVDVRGNSRCRPQMLVEPTITFASNLHFRWEYSSGNELFMVYTDYRDVTGGLRPNRGWDLRTRGFVIKINKIFRY